MPDRPTPSAEASAEELRVEILAAALRKALREADPTAFISGKPESRTVAIDGTFDLKKIVRKLFLEMDRRD
jgi:hypothetical protein